MNLTPAEWLLIADHLEASQAGLAERIRAQVSDRLASHLPDGWEAMPFSIPLLRTDLFWVERALAV